MEESTTTVNYPVDTYDEVKDEQSWIKTKLADLEDRSRRTNVKLRGIPESVLPADLQKYASDLMHAILPIAIPLEISIDHIHRVSKPPHLSASVPREVLMRVHFFHAKEMLLAAARAAVTLPTPFTELQLYPDLSKYTLQLRRQLSPVTKALHNHKIQHKWL